MDSDQNTTYEDIINTDIFELMGAKDMSEDKKKELYEKIMDTIRARATNFIGDKLTEEDLKTWQELKSPEEKNKFLQEKGIDVAAIMLQQALIYKTELVELSKQARGIKE